MNHERSCAIQIKVDDVIGLPVPAVVARGHVVASVKGLVTRVTYAEVP